MEGFTFSPVIPSCFYFSRLALAPFRSGTCGICFSFEVWENMDSVSTVMHACSVLAILYFHTVCYCAAWPNGALAVFNASEPILLYAGG